MKLTTKKYTAVFAAATISASGLAFAWHHGDHKDKEAAEKTEMKTIVDIAAAGAVMIDEAKVLMTDLEASNGVIHVIDKVVMP